MRKNLLDSKLGIGLAAMSFCATACGTGSDELETGSSSAALTDPVTLVGNGAVSGWRSFSGSTAVETPADLQAAFPIGAPYVAGAAYDPDLVTSSASSSPTSRQYFGAVTDWFAAVAGHHISPNTASTSPNSVFVLTDSMTLAVGSPVLVDGSTTFGGYEVGFGSFEITDHDHTTMPTTDIPTEVCLGEWELLIFTLNFRETSTSSLHIFHGYGTPDRSIDSDADGLTDGNELALGSNPCGEDTDGDGLVDGSDPDPLVPTTTSETLADAAEEAVESVLEIPPADFTGPNESAERGHQNALANRLEDVQAAIESGDYATALSILTSILHRLDGDPSPPDFMDPGPAKDAFRAEIEELIALVEAELAG